jgi:hypothetical protein
VVSSCRKIVAKQRRLQHSCKRRFLDGGVRGEHKKFGGARFKLLLRLTLRSSVICQRKSMRKSPAGIVKPGWRRTCAFCCKLGVASRFAVRSKALSQTRGRAYLLGHRDGRNRPAPALTNLKRHQRPAPASQHIGDANGTEPSHKPPSGRAPLEKVPIRHLDHFYL